MCDRKGALAPNLSQQVLNHDSANEIVALVPRMLVTQGVSPSGTRLIVRKAEYGLDQSPRDLALLQDAKLPALEIECESQICRLDQLKRRRHVFLVSDRRPQREFAATCSDEGEGEVAVWICISALRLSRLLARAEARGTPAPWAVRNQIENHSQHPASSPPAGPLCAGSSVISTSLSKPCGGL